MLARVILRAAKDLTANATEPALRGNDARVILSAAKDLTANATEPALRGNDARVILSAAKDLTAPGEWHGLREILRCAQDDMPMMLFHGMRFHISIWRYENCTFRQNGCQGKMFSRSRLPALSRLHHAAIAQRGRRRRCAGSD